MLFGWAKHFTLSSFMIKTNQSGRSMVEMLGVLAIIGVLSVGGIAGYSKAMNKYKINKTTDQISMLVANIRTMFATQGSYKGLTNSQAKKFGVVPNDMYTNVSSASIDDAFGGKVYIAPSKLNSNDGDSNKAFIIEYGGLTQEACITIVTGDWGSAQGSGLIGIAASVAKGTAAGAASKLESVTTATTDDNESNGYAVPGGSEVSTPVSVAVAQKWCSSNASDNSVAWKYY